MNSKAQKAPLRELPVVVVGGGPAGLACSQQLSKHSIEHVVLEKGSEPASCWRSLYSSLTLHTGKHLSTLPEQAFPPGTPMFVPKADFISYLDSYVENFSLPIECDRHATALEREGEKWLVETKTDSFLADVVIVATGIISSPKSPSFPQQEVYQGELNHSIHYQNPIPYLGKRVLIVGVGNSGGEIASELANAGVDVSIAVRSGARVVPRSMAGIPIQYIGFVMTHLPRIFTQISLAWMGILGRIMRGRPVLPPPRQNPCSEVPLIGFNLTNAIGTGKVKVRKGISCFTKSGVTFNDGVDESFDHVLLATGFQPALEFMGQYGDRDACGFADRTKRIQSTKYPNLYFVGHNYDMTGGLNNIRKDSRATADQIVASLEP